MSDNKNPLINRAQDYLRKHHIIELFEDLSTGLAYKKPENIEEYLIEQLEYRKSHGTPIGSPDLIAN